MSAVNEPAGVFRLADAVQARLAEQAEQAPFADRMAQRSWEARPGADR